MLVPPDVIQKVGLPTVNIDVDEGLFPVEMTFEMKAYVSSVSNNQLRTNLLHTGVPDDGHMDEGESSVQEYVFFESFYFQGCSCSRGGSERLGFEQFTEMTMIGSFAKNDETRKMQYEVTCHFNECHENGGIVESIGKSRATTWLNYLAQAS